MKSVKFTRSLADEMKRFLELKRVSETDYFSSAKLLFYFDRHLARQQFEGKILTTSCITRAASSGKMPVKKKLAYAHNSS